MSGTAVIEGKSRVITITPALSLVAYSVGDQMGVAMELPNAMDDEHDTGAVFSAAVYDKAAQGASFDILLFSEEPTLASADNAALDISDSDMASKFLGRLSILSGDYKSTASGKDCTLTNQGLLLQAAVKKKSIWAVLQCQGAPTYTSASDLSIKVGIVQD